MNNVFRKIHIFLNYLFKEKNNAITLAILCLAIFLRLQGLNKGLYSDEFGSIWMISNKNIIQTILALRTDTHPPLFFILLKFWSYISMNEAWLRLLSVIFSMGTIIISMKWLRRFSPLASNLAGLVLATLPMMLWESQDVRPYSLLFLAMSLSLYFASKISEEPKNKRWYFWLSLSLCIAIATHFIGIMMIIPIYVFILLSTKNRTKINYKSILTSIAFPISVFLLLSFWHYSAMLYKATNWWMPRPSIIYLYSISKELSGLTFMKIFLSSLKNVKPILTSYIYYLIIIIMTFIANIVFIFGKWKSNFPLLTITIIYWLEIALFSMFFVPVLTSRIAMIGVIPLIGFITTQLSIIKFRKIKRASIFLFSLLCLSFSINWINYLAWWQVENLKGIFKTIESHWEENALILMYPVSLPDTPTGYNALKYYFHAAPRERTIQIPYLENKFYEGEIKEQSKTQVINSLFQKLDKDIKRKKINQYPSKIFISLNKYLYSKEDLQFRLNLISWIIKNFKSQAVIEVVFTVPNFPPGIFLHDSIWIGYRIFESHLKAEFGPAFYIKRHPGFVHLKYNLSASE